MQPNDSLRSPQSHYKQIWPQPSRGKKYSIHRLAELNLFYNFVCNNFLRSELQKSNFFLTECIENSLLSSIVDS